MWYIESTPHIFSSASHTGFISIQPSLDGGVCRSENNKTANNNCINKWTFLRWRLGPSQPLIHDSESLPEFLPELDPDILWWKRNCERAVVMEQTNKTHWWSFSWCSTFPSPLSRIASSQHALVSYVRDQKNSENWYTMALRGPPYGPWWRQGSKSSTRCQYLYTVTYYMSLTFGRLKGSFLTKLVVARASSFEEARSKQRSTMESCEPGIGKWILIRYLAMQLIVLHLTVLRV